MQSQLNLVPNTALRSASSLRCALWPVSGMAILAALALTLFLPRVWAVPGSGPFRFTNIKQLTDGNVQVTYTGPLTTYRLWASTNPTYQQSISTLLLSSNMTTTSASFIDTQATNHPHRCYFITSP
jgi:hypothetical protein